MFSGVYPSQVCLVCSKLSATVVIDKQFHVLMSMVKAGLITSKDAEQHIVEIVKDIAKLDYTKSQHLKQFVTKQYSSRGSSLTQISPNRMDEANVDAEATSHELKSSEAADEMALQDVPTPTTASAIFAREP